MEKSNIIKICPCGKEFKVYPFEQLTRISCSKACANIYRKKKPAGYKCPKGAEAKMGSKNPQFGKIKDNPSYEALHHYIHKRLDPTKPKYCEHCRLEKKLELANKSHEYKRDITDWLWLCKKCHHKYDGADKYLELGRYRKGKWYKKKCKTCKKQIYVPKHLLERKKFCSRKCGMLYLHKNNKINHI